MANIDRVMPKAVIIPIFWGHDYVANPTTSDTLNKLLTDLATGPFLNGVAQYGVQRGSVRSPIIIDDTTPPQTITYRDTTNKLVDEVTERLINWIKAKLVPAPSSENDINQLYFIFPPTGTVFQTYNGPDDTIGNGVQAYHSAGSTNPPPPPLYNWAIVKTNDAGPASSSQNFVANLAQKVAHELMEQLVNRVGTYEEIGDPCSCRVSSYRIWNVQPFWSEWPGINGGGTWDKHCLNSDNPISLKQFLSAIGFDYHSQGLASLGTPVINVDYIALTMQSQTSPKTAPSDCFPPVAFTATPQANQTGYDVNYSGKGFKSIPTTQEVELYLSGLMGYPSPLGVAVTAVDNTGNLSGLFSFTCTNPAPSPNASIEVRDPISNNVIISIPISFTCTP